MNLPTLCASPRKWLRNRLLQICERLIQTDEIREAIRTSLGSNLLSPVSRIDVRTLNENVYSSLRSDIRNDQRDDLVIISGRFRSGSTLLWNLFRQVPEFTCYYEPLNERRWFDPRVRGSRVDTTHREVNDYWNEYQGLERAGRFFDDDWNHRNLFMPEQYPATRLRQYLDFLIDNAPNRPVLQFNRADFRLPWLRAQYPQARFIHLYRHPRDQWCSTLLRSTAVHQTATIDGFREHDHFYLLHWARDLSPRFPFLSEKSISHPYELYYLLWKLSYVYGRSYSDISVSFESLVSAPNDVIRELFSLVGGNPDDASRIAALVSPPPLGKWKNYATANWFENIERKCEAILQEFFQTSKTTAGPDSGRQVPFRDTSDRTPTVAANTFQANSGQEEQ